MAPIRPVIIASPARLISQSPYIAHGFVTKCATNCKAKKTIEPVHSELPIAEIVSFIVYSSVDSGVGLISSSSSVAYSHASSNTLLSIGFI